MKIAIITNGPHFAVGGVEKYSDMFYEYFGKKHLITEFPTLKIKKNIQNNEKPNPYVKMDYSLLGWKPHLIVWGGSYTRKNYKYIYQNYDLIIINSIFLPAKWIANPKTIVVQHMSKKWYTLRGKKWSLKFGQFINSILFGVGTISNAFKKVQNVVFYANETKALTTAKNVFFIPLAHKKLADLVIKKTSGQHFGFIGRIDNQQKNIKDLIKIVNQNDDVIIYGSGHNQRMLKQKLNNFNQYKGLLAKDKIDQKMQNLRCLILTSHHEGFCFSIVEALSNGTPVIAFDTFDALNFFIKSKAVFLIPRGDIQAFNQKISENALEFAIKHFTKESFWTKWENIINNFSIRKVNK